MEREQLEDYNAREIELANKLIRRLAHKKKVSPLDFYPEFKEILKQPYTTSLEPRAPVYVSLPYYNTLIVTIGPIKSPKDFEKMYGLTPEQLVELYKTRKVVLRLSTLPIDYVGLDYLDPILDLNPPSAYVRTLAFGAMLDESKSILDEERTMQRVRNEFRNLIEAKFSNIREKDLKNILAILPELPYRKYSLKETISRLFAFHYLQLKRIGYVRISELLKNCIKKDLCSASILYEYYRLFLLGPIHYSLDGIHTVPNDIIEILRKRIKAGDFKKVEIFPIDIGKCLVDNLELVRVKGLGNALDVYPEYDKARKALFELDKAVSKRAVEKVVDRARSLIDVWNETTNVVMDMLEKHHSYVKMFKVFKGSLCVVGTLIDLLLNFNGILATLASFTTVFDFERPLADKVIKLKKPDHIVAVFELKQSARLE